MSQTDHDQGYDEGFSDGIRFVITHVRIAADQVEENKQKHFATKLRELASELERHITQ